MNIVIRTDASMVRGSGHVMRCLCLADVLRKNGHTTTFASVALPPQLRAMIVESGHAILDVPDPGQSGLPAEAPWPEAVQAADAASVAGYDLAIVDHYGLGAAWERAAAASAAKIVAIDDLGREHVCDVLLDQNFYRDTDGRYAGRLPIDATALVGPRFALIRPEFASARRQQDGGNVRRIVVFVGGMDAQNITSRILEALSQPLPHGPAVDIVIGAGHPDRAAIEQLGTSRDGWTCHVQTTRMAELLADADLVIGAGGTNTWERMVVGVPSIAVCIAENQRMLLDECAAIGALYVPDEDALSDAAVLRTHVLALLGNSRLRDQISREGMALVDGQGAQRVARVIGALEPVSVRPATDADRDMLRKWRNHEAVRAVSRSKGEVTADAHNAWFAAVLADAGRSLLVGERGGSPFGCVRFDEIGPDAAEVSIYLSSDAFGMGLGRSLLLAGEAWMAINRPHIARIHAEVLGGNTASANLFERCGYTPDSSRYSKGLHI